MNKVIIYDFDGVMTDNKVLISEDGKESVSCNRSDGLAISMLRKKNISQIIVSTETNKVVSKRAKKLKIDFIDGVKNKKEIILKIKNKFNFNLSKSVYIGNDINDLDAMSLFGLKICPHDAYDRVKEISDIVTNSKGGDGVIRELIDNKNFCKFLNF
tara:strand:- start:14 stop:484 length:471 start_codon:yes stop_codon:yes gene_type:complete